MWYLGSNLSFHMQGMDSTSLSHFSGTLPSFVKGQDLISCLFNFILCFIFCFVFLGHTRRYSEVTTRSVLWNYSWQYSRTIWDAQNQTQVGCPFCSPSLLFILLKMWGLVNQRLKVFEGRVCLQCCIR